MPVSELNILPQQGAWGIWCIKEHRSELWKQLHTTDQCEAEYRQISHATKKLEWLASRLMIQKLIREFGESYQGIFKDGFGKPHLRNSRWSISIAHCYPFAAGAINYKGSVGIDIERPRAQLLKIAPRFLSEDEKEIAGEDPDLLCHFWTGKEALYKIYGRKKLIFRKNILLSPIAGSDFQGIISTDQGSNKYTINYHRTQGHLVAFSREILE